MDVKTAERLVFLRKNAGLSQEELADRIGGVKAGGVQVGKG